MQVGVITKTFVRSDLEQVFDAVIQHGLSRVQFGLVSANLPLLPEIIEPDLTERIRRGCESRGIRIDAISGTYNIIHPDREERLLGLGRLRILAEACPAMGVSVMALCSGTGDPNDMWKAHPNNNTDQAWSEMLVEMRQIVKIGEETGVIMAVEPEVSNVVSSASKARRLLDEIGSAHLKIIMDGANLFPQGALARQREVLDHAFELLGQDIVLAHAKDISHDGDAGHEPAGHGLLDYPYYLALLNNVGYSGPLILHSLAEDQVQECSDFLRSAAQAKTP